MIKKINYSVMIYVVKLCIYIYIVYNYSICFSIIYNYNMYVLILMVFLWKYMVFKNFKKLLYIFLYVMICVFNVE